MPGPAKIPTVLKLVRGTLQKSRGLAPEPVLPAFATLPRPPVWMRKNLHALREWRRLGPHLITYKLLNEGNLGAFAMLCAIYGDNAANFSKGIKPRTSDIAVYRTLCGSLGLLAMNLGAPSSTNPFASHQPKRPGTP